MAEGGMREFITRILGDMEGNAILSLAGGKTEPTDKAPFGKLIVDRHHWFAYPVELDAMVAFAEKAHGERRDAYISPMIYGDKPFMREGKVIERNREGRPLYSRSRDNALFAQTIFMDSDTCPPDAFRVSPSIHVDTSEGHGHDYWRLVDPVPAALAADVAHRITTAHREQGSDPSGWSQNKVLRLPTFNTAYDELAPFRVQWHDSGEVYFYEDVAGAYEDVEVVAAAGWEPVELAPVPKLEGLPDFEETVARIPASNTRLNDLIYKVPKGGPDGWRSEQRYALLLDLKRFGFTDEEAVAVAWHSPAASKWREDQRGVAGLWWELQARVLPVLAQERGEGISAAPASRLEPSSKGPKLLSPSERIQFDRRTDLVTLYVEWAKSKVPVFNSPLHHINAWTFMSVAVGELGVIPKEPSPMPLNLYSMTLSGSSSGKSEATSMMLDCIHSLFPHDNPDIGSSHSKEALIEQLIDRDGKVSFMHAEEAHGRLAELKQGGYHTGMQQLWTQIYDGTVPSLGRVGKKDLAKAGRKTVTTMHMIGTPRRMFDVLDKEMFYEGYLARQIWVIGEEQPTTRDMLRSKFGAGGRVEDRMPKWFASHFHHLRSRLRATLPIGESRVPLWPSDEAIERVDAAKWKIHQHFERESDMDLWRTVLRRMYDIIWKVAGIRALIEGRTFIALEDVIVSLGYVEQWLGYAVEVASGISDTFFSRQCDEIERFIAVRANQEADLGAIYRFRKGDPKRITDEYLQSLVFQGRIAERTTASGFTTYKIKEQSQ